MPPKANEPSKKTEAKIKAKIIEDKTFGLKNKNKSSKVAKYIQTVENQVNSGGKPKARNELDPATLAKEKKKQEEERKAELALLFKPIVQQKVPFGVDPKTVLCEHFKLGTCTKGDKCKFSHDLNINQKAAKINIYSDKRDNEDDTIDQWDTGKLEEVVEKKHGKGCQPTTDIVCKYFLDAIEQKRYGWFWECPNGGDTCKYRHALPPGFVLSSPAAKREAAAAAAADTITLEEFLEVERHKLLMKGGPSTPITADSFAKWKLDRKAKAEAEEKARAEKKELDAKAGKYGSMSGRDLFTFQPDMFQVDLEDEEGAGSEVRLSDYNRNEDEEQEDEAAPQDASLFLDEDLENLDISSGDEQDQEETEEDQ